jgi:Glu-tRNA(Gln) amidotransferase subunit E-like FAD-binding protein
MDNNEQKKLLQQYLDTNQNEYFDMFKDFVFNNWYRKTKNIYADLKEDPFVEALDYFKKHIERGGNRLKNIDNIKSYFTMCLKNKAYQIFINEKKRTIRTVQSNEINEFIGNEERNLTREEIEEIFAHLLREDNKDIPDKCKKILHSLLNEKEGEVRDEFIKKGEIKNKDAYNTQKSVCMCKIKKWFLENHSEIFNKMDKKNNRVQKNKL